MKTIGDADEILDVLIGIDGVIDDLMGAMKFAAQPQGLAANEIEARCTVCRASPLARGSGRDGKAGFGFTGQTQRFEAVALARDTS